MLGNLFRIATVPKLCLIVGVGITIASAVICWSMTNESIRLGGEPRSLEEFIQGQATAADRGLGELMAEYSVDEGEAEADASSEALTRDPLVPYRAPQKVKPPPKPAKPRPDLSYQLIGVIIDNNPRAIMRVGDEDIIVKIGDALGKKHIVAITHRGVTVEGGHTYEPLPED